VLFPTPRHAEGLVLQEGKLGRDGALVGRHDRLAFRDRAEREHPEGLLAFSGSRSLRFSRLEQEGERDPQEQAEDRPRIALRWASARRTAPAQSCYRQL
jgi:hypothetical protein